MQDQQLKEAVLAAVDQEQVVRELFPGWKAGANVSCPFTERHGSGEDRRPSLTVSQDGKAYCHSCGYKATSVIGLLCDLKKKTFLQVCRELWVRFVEPLVPEIYVKSCQDRLASEKLVLSRLHQTRGVTQQVVQAFQLGWDGYRLTIPVRNKHGFCVNVRRYDILKKDENGPKVISYSKGFGTARLWPVTQLSGKGPLLILEGEMDTLCAISQGFRAVTVTIGAATWRDTWSTEMNGQDVVLVPDLDKVGLEGAEKRRASIAKHAKTVSVVRLPLKGNRDEKDFTDWVVRHKGGFNEFWKLSPAAKPAAPKADRPGVAVPQPAEGIEAFRHKTPAEELNLVRAFAATGWLDSHGAFFKNQDGDLFYAEDGGKTYRVNDRSEQFTAYLAHRLDHVINPASSSGRFVIRHVVSHGHSTNAGSVSGSWCLYHKGAMYVYAGKDRIVKASEGKLEVIKNAVNPDGVLLESPDYCEDWTPDLSADPKLAYRMLWDDMARYFPVSHTDKYLLLSWMQLLFFKEYIKPKPLVRLMAKTSSGKSTLSKTLSTFIYGAEVMQQSATTSAALYSISQRYPFLLLDNIETRNMTQALEDFLINAATGGGKWKRQLSTDSSVIQEQANCLVATNGIEPINKRELISRTLEVQLDLNKYGAKGFYETQVFSNLKKRRGYMLSGILKGLSLHAIPRLKSNEVQRIAKEFGGHSKERFDESIGLMAITLDTMWQYVPSPAIRTSHAMVATWLKTQTKSSDNQDEGTNDVLYFMSELVDRRGEIVDAKVQVQKGRDGRLHVLASSRQLLSDFRVLARKLGIRCPWLSERHLDTRIQDAGHLLARQGWRHDKRMLKGGKWTNDFNCEAELSKV